MSSNEGSAYGLAKDNKEADSDVSFVSERVVCTDRGSKLPAQPPYVEATVADPQQEGSRVVKRQHPDTEQELEPEPKRVNKGKGNETRGAKTEDPAPKASTSAEKGWSSRSWGPRQYHDLAIQARANFPVAAFAAKWSKTEKEVSEVFAGVIEAPVLKAGNRSDGARGGLGHLRMNELRGGEKALREFEKEMENAPTKNQPKLSRHLLCHKCQKLPATKPSNIEEAEANVRAAQYEVLRRGRILAEMVRKEQEDAKDGTYEELFDEAEMTEELELGLIEELEN
ncbi:hypothetical protein MMC13_002659 [Lambiella insularis]|nr:hypothetical protein [Lambiella insularis]